MKKYDIADCVTQNAKLVPNLLGGAFIQFGAQEGGCVSAYEVIGNIYENPELLGKSVI